MSTLAQIRLLNEQPRIAGIFIANEARTHLVAYALLRHLRRRGNMHQEARDRMEDRRDRFWYRTFWASLAVCEVLGLILIRSY